VLSTTANAARTSLQSQYNNVLAQIDTLAKDSSFNGTNLLAGDNLTVSFNEDGFELPDHHGLDHQLGQPGPQQAQRDPVPGQHPAYGDRVAG